MTRTAGPVAVIGAGVMGRGIATASLAAGLPTVLVDIDSAALAAAERDIGRRMARAPSGGGDWRERLRLAADLAGGVAGAAAVIEAVPEVESIKQETFRRLGESAPPGALLASNTSTMSVTALARAAGDSPRVIGMHFFNPAHRMALVEVVTGESTAPATVSDAVALATSLGKEPIVVRDVPGFVTSRLGLLLGNEAMRLVEEGVASASDVDKALRLGYGHPMGPLELADLVGLDARLNNARSMHRRSGLAVYRPPAILERLVAAGHLGRKSGQGFYRYDAQGRVLGPAGEVRS